jgi:hypothetical protein
LCGDDVAVTLLHNPIKALINNLPVRMSLNLTWLAALRVRGNMDENKPIYSSFEKSTINWLDGATMSVIEAI